MKTIGFAIILSLLALSCTPKDLERPQAQLPQPAIGEEAARVHAAPLYGLRLMKFSLFFVNAQYYDLSRVNWQKMAVNGIDALQNMVPEMVARFDKRLIDLPDSVEIRVNNEQKQFDLSSVKTLVDAHQLSVQVFNFVLERLTDQQEASDLEYAMINGMFTTLDPHTNLLTPRVFDDMMTSQVGFAGLGFVVGVREAGLLVISPIDGAPAQRAGIQMGDRILQIDGESTENMLVQDAVDRMRGEAGTKVVLLIMRKGWAEPRRFELVRAEIKVNSVVSKALDKDNVGYVRIKSFDQNTARELREHLARLHEAMPQMSGLMMDLRGNAGGLLMQSIEVAQIFLNKGDTVVTVEGVAGTQRDSAKAQSASKELGYGMLVLMDGGSASASEIVAGALQYHHRALVVGEQSFGKGSVQTLKQNDDNSALKITTAQYLTPGDISIQGVGIVPDIELRAVYANDKDEIALIPSDKMRRENNLEQSLQSEKTLERSSFIELQYLYEESKAEKDKAKDLGLSVYDLRSTADYTEDDVTRFGSMFLRQAKVADAKEILDGAGDFFAAYKAGFLQKLTSKLRAMGIDWSQSTQPRCEQFSWELLKGPGSSEAEPVVLTAGQKNEVTMRVKNLCEKGDLEQFSILTSANNMGLDELEFVFGRVGAGKQAQYTRVIDLPKSADARMDLVELKFYEGGHVLPEGGHFMSITNESAAPHFAYSLWLDDSVAGNGDGILQRGETVDLMVWAKNESALESGKVTLSLSNESGRNVLLIKGKDSASSIGALKSHQFALRFKLNEHEVARGASSRGGKAKTYKTDEVDFKLELASDDYNTKLSQTLKIPVNTVLGSPDVVGESMKNSGVVAAQKLVYEHMLRSCITPRRGDEQGGCGILRAPRVKFKTNAFNTTESRVKIEADLSDDTALRDYQAYVWSLNGLDFQIQKLDFAPLSGTQASIHVDVPLEIGDNTVMVLLRDNDKLEEAASLHVLRTKEP